MVTKAGSKEAFSYGPGKHLVKLYPGAPYRMPLTALYSARRERSDAVGLLGGVTAYVTE